MFVLPLRVGKGEGGAEGAGGEGSSSSEDGDDAGVAGEVSAPLNVFIQQHGHHVLFSDLEEYKLLGADVTPLATLTHYAELAEEKGVVVARLDVVRDKALPPQRARELLEAAHRLYVDDEWHELVHDFNHKPQTFDFERVLKTLGHQES